MSDFRSVAVVTATLQRNLQAAVQADVAGATVTTVRPAEGDDANLPTTGVNLCLFQVAPNAHWRNADLPTRRPGSNGEVVQRPQAAVDLHYVLSFYGSDLALEPQRLLGSTIAFLETQPVLTRAHIEAAIADPTRPYLADSDLADQIERVRFSLAPMSLEELSRIWSVFFQVRYVLSVAYQASVVLLERQLVVSPALPARELDVAVVPTRRPSVSGIVAQAGEESPIVAGSPVHALGGHLHADVVRVEVDGIDVPATEVRPDRIAITLPSDLAAGPHGLQVRHGLSLGAPAQPHLAFLSNVASFVLQPEITGIAVTDVSGTGSSPRSATLVIGVDPTVHPAQRVTVELLIDDGVAHTFHALPRPEETGEVTAAISGVAAGAYVCRVRVDGAASPLDVDAGGHPTGPEATIP